MENLKIINRKLSADEIEKVDSGFDQDAIEQGAALESTETFTSVALDADRFIGCAVGLAHKNGEVYSGWLHLTDLFVEKGLRSEGVGTILLKAFEDQVRNIGIENIWLWTSGEPSLRFYARHGYKQFTEMENWYSDGSSRVGLRKNLANG